MRRTFFLLLIFFFSFRPAQAVSSGISWQTWSDGIFDRAARENRLVILDLEAVWCHWCHVMDEKTYSQAEIVELIGRNYLPVRVDQDSRPDLANRYRDYGWPATIVFDAKGRELAKRAGYIEASELAELLRRLVRDPRPMADEDGSAGAKTAPKVLSPELTAELIRRHRGSFDLQQGGLKLNHKFVDADSIEYSLGRAQAGSEEEAQRARQSLQAGLNLIDPAWGGVYQYSHGGDWTHPHFEKIMSFQRDNLRIYSMAYARWKDPAYLQAAKAIRAYLKNFLLSPEGAFYASQDADVVRGEHAADYYAKSDADRRRIGMPRIDRHLYARENGWAIAGLLEFYRATGEIEALNEAKAAAEWVLNHRRLGSGPYSTLASTAKLGASSVGGFKHDAENEGGPFLSDTLAMGMAALKLYALTAERPWLRVADESGEFIQRNFSAQEGRGYFTARGGGILPPVLTIEENIAAARFFNLLSHYTGKEESRRSAAQAMAYLADPAVATSRLTEPGVLLAAEELALPPLHLTVVGAKEDPQAAALFAAASRYPEAYLRVEWWDRKEGPMPNGDVQYPQLERSAAFVCTSQLCSSPVFQPDRLEALIRKLKPQNLGTAFKAVPRYEDHPERDDRWKIYLPPLAFRL